MTRLEFNAAAGFACAVVSWLYGGWSNVLSCLLFFMVIDYLTGIMVASFGNSTKTAEGGLNSSIGWKGLVKKVSVFVLLAVVYRMESLTPQAAGFMDVAAWGFICNEVISLTENIGLLGVPLGPIGNMIELLKSENKNSENDNESEK